MTSLFATRLARLFIASLTVLVSFQPAAAVPAPAAEAAPAALRPYQPPPEAEPKDWPNERLVAFMRELTDYVYQHHVVRDARRPVYGMTYEFFKDGRQTQDFPLDSMHDGAWFATAMITAHRADPGGEYLPRVLKYQVPFYVNILSNSDRLFPDYGKTSEDNRAPEHPIKGRIPLAWDDGEGYELTADRHCRRDYNRTQGPNHLAQDVADMLANAWLATRDPAIPESLLLLHRYRKEYNATVPVIAFAAGITSGDRALARAAEAPRFAPTDLPGYAGAYQQNGEPLAAYDDPLGWAYGRALALAALDGTMPDEYVVHCAARALGHAQCMELFYADRPYPYGMHFFDIQNEPRFVQGAGRLDGYVSTAKMKFGGRGIQMAWVAAGILPELRRRPELWERYYRQHHAGEPLVRITDDPPPAAGWRPSDRQTAKPLAAPGVSLWMISDPKNLHVLVESDRPSVQLAIRHAGPVAGQTRQGRFTIVGDSPAGRVEATNDKGETILCAATFSRSGAGERWTAALRVPYSVMPGQSQWINGMDNGRYVVSIDGTGERTIYMLSEPKRVIHRLEAMSLGAVATWHGVWKELGVIPSGYRGPLQTDRGWEWSDAGNYAHLIRTIALVLIDRAGTSEWAIARRDAPRQPKPAGSLPDETLRAQGLK